MVEIRLLDPKDASMYQEIRLAALKANPEAFSSSYEEELEYSLEKFESRLNFDHVYTFGAFEDTRLIGVVTLILETRNKTKHRAPIVAMYVYSEHRKAGVGKNLMSEAIQLAKELERIEQINLTVTSTNVPAKRLYNSLGFTTYGVDKRALKIEGQYFDDELMVRFV
jgi:RimJ/RimL family protein N-acetyltransferase